MSLYCSAVRDLLGRFLDSPFSSPPSNSTGGGGFPFLVPLALPDSFSPMFLMTVRGTYCFSRLYAWKHRMYGSGFYSVFVYDLAARLASMAAKGLNSLIGSASFLKIFVSMNLNYGYYC
jgi:hypothetical protein